MVNMMRIAVAVLLTILLGLALGSCNKQTGEQQESGAATTGTAALPVAEFAADVIPIADNDEGQAAVDDSVDDAADTDDGSGEDSDDGADEDADGDGNDDGDENDGGDGDGDDDEQAGDDEPGSGLIPPLDHNGTPVDVPALFKRRCSGCHGDDLKGTKSGPALQDMAQHYDADGLKRFLDDPAAYALGNQRLIDLGRQYNIVMPPARFRPAEMDALAAWLLER